MKDDDVWLLGGGGHALVAAEILSLTGHKVRGFYADSTHQSSRLGPRKGTIADACSAVARGDGGRFFCAIGDNGTRRSVVRRIEAAADRCGAEMRWACAIHPAAVVSPSAEISRRGVLMAPGAIAAASASVGEQVILNTGCSVDHECIVEPFAHIAPGARLCGNVCVGEAALVGVGCSVVPRVRIGAGSTVGAGSIVLADVPRDATVHGVVKAVRDVPRRM